MTETDQILSQAGLSERDLDELGQKLLQQIAEAKKMQMDFPNNEAIQSQSGEMIRKTLSTFQRLVARLAKQSTASTPVPTPAKKERPLQETEQRSQKIQVVKSPFEAQNSNKEEDPIEVEVEEIPNQRAKAEYQPGPMSDFAQQYANDIATCRERIRAENRRKREIREAEEGPKPKVSRVVRLQRKILGVLSVMPPEKKHDQQALQITETLLSELLVGLSDAWGLKVSREAQKDASQKFEDLHQKATKQ